MSSVHEQVGGVSDCGSCASDHEGVHGHSHGGSDFDLRREVLLVVAVAALFIFGVMFEAGLHKTPFSIAEYLVFLTAYLMSGWTVLVAAGRNILRGHWFDENFLMTIATLGAIAIHNLPEAVGVMLFFRVGELFQGAALHRSRRSIQSLMEIRPDVAHLKTEAGLTTVSPEVVSVGAILVVKPGEKVPLDGEILDGESRVDTAVLTGESVPRRLRAGDSILAGMINQSGVLTIQVTQRFAESSVAKILDLVEQASSKKAPTEKFITTFARRYTPIVVLLSLAIAFLPPFFIAGATHAEWVYRALVLLVISCPCGLVISIPLGYFGGIGGAARRGILVKGAAFLDALSAVKAVVFDKTGTLTQGVFKVVKISSHNGYRQDEVLRFAAEVEYFSNHPIAQSIRDAYERPIDPTDISNYQEVAGCGVQATVGNQRIIAGNDRFLHREQIEHPSCLMSGTVVHVAVEGDYVGALVIEDELKADAVAAIELLKRSELQFVSMLTGDSQAVAKRMAQVLKLDDYQAELLPEEKVIALERLQQKAQGRIAFVGDGINDAPVIARADIGIAMGGLGSDAAIETADVVLMTDAPSKVAEAIQVARKTRRIVWQNIILATGVKAVFIGLGLLGLATMWLAVFADVGVALMAIANATRVLR